MCKKINSCLSVIGLLLILLPNSAIADYPATFEYWDDIRDGQRYGVLPPSSDQAIDLWHSRWPGHPDMYLSPPACVAHGDKLHVTCPETNCGGILVCGAVYSCPGGAIPIGDMCPGQPPDETEKQLGEPGDCAGTGNPCNATTGNKYQAEADYSGGVLTWHRHYNSGAADSDGPLGFGWSHDYHHRLDFEDQNNLALRQGSGKVLRFSHGGSGWGSDADVDEQLISNTTGYLVSHPDGAKEQYDQNGKLLWLESAAGLITQFTYGADGLTSVTGPYGHTLALTYDANQRISTVTDSGGGVIGYSYDSSGNLISVTRADGTVRSYHYEDATHIHALTGITDANGDRFATWAYASDGKAILSEHAVTTNGIGQEQVTLSYDSDTQTTVTHATGDNELITFSENLGIRNLTSRVFVADGKGISQTFDANNNLTSRTDAEGNVTSYTYNGFNQRTSMTEASGTAEARTTSYTYLSDDLDLPVTVTRDGVSGPQTHVTTTQYDAALNPVSITQSGFDASGNSVTRQTQFSYDSDGRLTSIDGPRSDVNDVTTLAYHDCTTGSHCGQLASMTNALGQVTSYDSYNAHGQVTSITDANGITTSLVYDARQRLVQQTINGSRTTDYSYDGVGQLTQLTLPDGSGFTYEYDAAHDLTRITDSLGQRTDYTYDARGNRVGAESRNSNGAVVTDLTYGYDLRSRVNQVNDSIGTTDWVLDALGNAIEQTDPNGHTTTRQYDGLNQLTQRQGPLGDLITQQFDPAGRSTHVTAANGAATAYDYDDLGNPLSEQSPDRGTVQYQYDPAGNLTQATDARGITVNYSFDALNRLTLADYPGTEEDIVYQYDTCANGVGRLCTITDQTGTTAYQFDAYGNITQVLRTSFGADYTTTYGYDTLNRIVTMGYPTGLNVTYSRDALGRITQVSTDQHGMVQHNIEYRADDQIASRDYGNGLSETRSYDAAGRLTSQTVATTTISYGYDPAGNLISQDNLGTSSTYDYDGLHRLTSASYPGQSLSNDYAYDSNGNRQSDNQYGTTLNYDYQPASNRLIEIGGVPVTLDAAGNTLAALDRAHSYNHQGHLRFTVHQPTGIESHTYTNALAQRTLKVIIDGANQQAIFYHYDLAGHLIAETDGNGALIRHYLWLEDEPIAQDAPTLGGAVALHTDHLGTPRWATNGSGDLVWRWYSTAFGAGAPNEDIDGDGQLTEINLRFPGQYFDQETGLHYNWNRYYDPGTGRYITSDPIGLQGGVNTYGYVGGNPLKLVDFYGLEGVCAIPGCLDQHPTTNCSFVASCVEAIDDKTPDILPKDIPKKLRDTLNGIGKGGVALFAEEVIKQMVCAEMNTCQCSGTCPDQPAWPPPPPEEIEEPKKEDDC